MFCKATLTLSFRVRERPATQKFEMYQIHRNLQAAYPFRFESTVDLRSETNECIEYYRLWTGICFVFQRYHVHITVYIILRDDVIMRLYILLVICYSFAEA